MQKAASGPQGREAGAATRRQQPAIKTQLARGTKQRASVAQESSITDRQEAMQQQAQGAEQGRHPHLPVGAGSKAAALLRPRKSWRPTDMAEAAGSETGAT